MLVNKNFAFAGCLALSAVAMTGCGGGGGDEPSSGENPPGRDINGDETEKTHLNWSDDQTTWDQKNWS